LATGAPSKISSLVLFLVVVFCLEEVVVGDLTIGGATREDSSLLPALFVDGVVTL